MITTFELVQKIEKLIEELGLTASVAVELSWPGGASTTDDANRLMREEWTIALKRRFVLVGSAVDGSYHCCQACILRPERIFEATSAEAMLAHLEEHRAAGHRIHEADERSLRAMRGRPARTAEMGA